MGHSKKFGPEVENWRAKNVTPKKQRRR